ncbi:MAG: hypothetical protein H6Q89_1299, partial [Myxococcaceae bacterium]|nr:hypothetical protein [Myxococcaceae bacterium]
SGGRGGTTGSTYLNDVQVAAIGADGGVGTWAQTTFLNSSRANHTSQVNNGFFYVMGGLSFTATYLNDVRVAPINANGTLGSFTATTAFTQARADPASAVYNGFLYVSGGYDGTAYRNDVQVAPINVDGTLGTWTSTTAFPTVRSGHTMVAYNGNLYVLGGYGAGASYRNDVQVAPINANGTVGTWRATTSFTAPRGNHATVANNARLYVIGGGDGTFRSDVQVAPILP